MKDQKQTPPTCTRCKIEDQVFNALEITNQKLNCGVCNRVFLVDPDSGKVSSEIYSSIETFRQ